MIETLATTREDAHAAARIAYAEAQRLIAEGKTVVIRAAELEQDRSLQQNRAYWGLYLKTLSETPVNGQHFAPESWHLLMRRKFLGYAFTSVKLPGAKRKTTHKALRSTRDLTVRQFATYLEQIAAFAATELGVTITGGDDAS